MRKLKSYVLWPAICITFLSQGGYTSDKGIRAEIITGTSSLFCTTSILADMKPLMERVRNHGEKDSLARPWAEILAKHNAEIDSLLSARLFGPNYNRAYFESAAIDIWENVSTTCPGKVTSSTGKDYAYEFLMRYFEVHPGR